MGENPEKTELLDYRTIHSVGILKEIWYTYAPLAHFPIVYILLITWYL
jgi:hypothetical protein